MPTQADERVPDDMSTIVVPDYLRHVVHGIVTAARHGVLTDDEARELVRRVLRLTSEYPNDPERAGKESGDAVRGSG
jgi:plasmid stability protein